MDLAQLDAGECPESVVETLQAYGGEVRNCRGVVRAVIVRNLFLVVWVIAWREILQFAQTLCIDLALWTAVPGEVMEHHVLFVIGEPCYEDWVTSLHLPIGAGHFNSITSGATHWLKYLLQNRMNNTLIHIALVLRLRCALFGKLWWDGQKGKENHGLRGRFVPHGRNDVS